MINKTEEMKKFASKTLTKIGMKSASLINNQSCILVLYQPKQPKTLKKYFSNK